MEIKIALSGVKLGVVEADGASVVLVHPDLAKLMDEVCARKRAEFTVESLAEAEPVRAVRAMFREWGMDPSKYRPSSEALLRRVVQGKGLYRVSNVVDIGNLGSLETGWPYGCYDRSKIQAPVALRHGAAAPRRPASFGRSRRPIRQPHQRFHAQHDHRIREGNHDRDLRSSARRRRLPEPRDDSSERAAHAIRKRL
jgi:hypothetical protein